MNCAECGDRRFIDPFFRMTWEELALQFEPHEIYHYRMGLYVEACEFCTPLKATEQLKSNLNRSKK